MNNHSHATHRLIGQDASEGEAPISFGYFYPEGDIVALADDRMAAERAVRALRDAGMQAEDMDVLDGPSFVKAIRAIERGRGVLARIAAFVAVEEGMTMNQYVAEAEAGRLVLVVHATRRPSWSSECAEHWPSMEFA